MIVHNIAFKETFETDFLYKYYCGAYYDPMNTQNDEHKLPGLKEIPIISPVRYVENGNESNSDFINENQYLEIGGNKSFIVDFEVWTKESQVKIVCKESICSDCQKAEKVMFSKKQSFLELLVDKPDDRNNTNIILKSKETITLF